MAQDEEEDSFAGAFRKESAGSRRNVPWRRVVGKSAGPRAARGYQLIREQEASDEVPLATDGELPAPGAPPGEASAAADFSWAASQMHLLVNLPEDWPSWSLTRRAVKRSLDVVLSIVALCLLLPVLLAITLAIRVESGGGVIYRQRRCGREGSPFEMLKFRSMVPGADALLVDLRDHNESDGLLFKIKQDPRITRVGAFLRRYSLDELPQLMNVVKGDMSLVGPRPLPVDPEAFGPIDSHRHAVRPGLTCHWQVSGRSEVSYGQMVEMDLSYIRDSSIWTDLRLIALTVPVALGGKGAY